MEPVISWVPPFMAFIAHDAVSAYELLVEKIAVPANKAKDAVIELTDKLEVSAQDDVIGKFDPVIICF